MTRRLSVFFALVLAALTTTGGSPTAENTFQVLHTFSDRVGEPTSLMMTHDGALYGTATHGGEHDLGYIFRVIQDPDGSWRREIVHEFQPDEGLFPTALAEGPDGALYGMLEVRRDDPTESLFRLTRDGSLTVLKVLDYYDWKANGGAGGYGPLRLADDGYFYGILGRDLFRMRPDPFEYAVVHHFTSSEGAPTDSFIQGSDGKLYGALTGFTGFGGRIVSVTLDGIVTTLHDFVAPCSNGSCGSNTDGWGPLGIVQAPDGKLYGVTEGGGPSNLGTAYRLNIDGSGFEVLDSTHGWYRPGRLVVGADGAVYGLALGGGNLVPGHVFRIAADGVYQMLHVYTASEPQGYFHLPWEGKLLGLAISVEPGRPSNYFSLFSMDLSGSLTVEARLYDEPNPLSLSSSLVLGADGAWYGTSNRGGLLGGGMVYRLGPSGDVTSFHDFVDPAGGYYPTGLTRASDGNFYGVTQGGVIYRLTPGGAYTVLHYFAPGDNPNLAAPLVEGPNGALYGASATGIFRLAYDGAYTVLTSAVVGAPNSMRFTGMLAVDPDGTVFGIGSIPTSPEIVQFFKIDPAGTFSVLHTFNFVDGPTTLMRGADAALYGTTLTGGSNQRGSIIRLDRSGTIETLYSFELGFGFPTVPMVAGVDGRLYGAAHYTSTAFNSPGGLFKFDPPSRTFEHLYDLNRQIDGYSPAGALTFGPDLAMYGVHMAGGSAGHGTAFRFVTPITSNLGPTAVATAMPATSDATSSGGASVTLSAAGSSDPEDDGLTFTWTGPFGSAVGHTVMVTMPIGTHTATLTASDGHGGVATATTGPIVVRPRANDDSYTFDQFGTLNVPAPGVLANDFVGSGDSVEFAPPAGFSLTNQGGTGGFTLVSNTSFAGTLQFGYVVHTAAGDSNIAQVNLTLRDITPPVIAPISQVNATATSSTGGFVTLPVPSVTDQGTGVQSVVCSRTSGSFPLGHTTVTCTATDYGGNTSNITYTVFVGAQSGYRLITIHLSGPQTGGVSVIPIGQFCGGASGSTCTYQAQAGTNVRLTANAPAPAAPGVFSNGSGSAACAPYSTCTFPLNADSEVTATFTLATTFYTLTIDLTGAGRGDVGVDSNRCQNFDDHPSSLPTQVSVCQTRYAQGSLATLQSNAPAGSKLVGFSSSVGCNGPGPSCSFALNGDATVTTTYAELSSVSVSPLSDTLDINQTRSFTAYGTYGDTTTSPLSSGMGTWRTRTSMQHARYNFGADAAQGRIFAIGGVDQSGPLGSVEAYDPFINSWQPAATMPTPRSGQAVAAMHDRFIYAAGGSAAGACPVDTLERYDADPFVDAWSTLEPMPGGPRRFLSGAVVGGTFYAIGGESGTCFTSSGIALKRVEAYTPGVGWTAKADMPTARRFFGVGVVDGIIYAVGGDDESNNLATVEAYDPATNTWSTKAPLPSRRSLLAVAAIDGVLYAFGGNDNGYAGSVYAYDPAANGWSNRSFIPSVIDRHPTGPGTIVVNGARAEPAAVSMGGTVFLMGGLTQPGGAPPTPLVTAFVDHLVWSVADTRVATVNQSGNATGRSTGDTTVRARAGSIPCVSGGCASVSVTSTVANTPPTVTIFGAPGGGTPSVTIGTNQNLSTTGSANGSFRDPDSSQSWTATVNYGDGSGTQPLALGPGSPPQGPTGTFSLNHTYSNPGGYVVTVTVTDSDGGVAAATLNVTVNGPTAQIFVNVPNSLTTQVNNASWGCGSFLDTNPSGGAWSGTVNYGDGSGDQPLPLTLPGSGPCAGTGSTGSFSFNHAYASTGQRTVTVWITNTVRNMSKTASFQINVEAPEPPPCAVITFTISGNVPFEQIPVTLSRNGETFDAALPLGTNEISFEDDEAGTYDLRFNPPSGFVVTPAELEFTVVCGHDFSLTAVVSAGNTPTGDNVQVAPATSGGDQPMTLTFSQVSTGGQTSLSVSTIGPAIPSGFEFAGMFFDVTTTATFNGAVEICTTYAGMTFSNPDGIRLFHYEGSAWVDVTTSVDAANEVVCGTTTSLSPFAVVKADTAAPTITSATPSTATLWPANHKMVAVTITARASDNMDPSPLCRIESVTSSEPVNGLGDGDAAPDRQVTGALAVSLRAERSGGGSGRTYTIRVACSDGSGNSATTNVLVEVPHDRRR